MRSSLRIVLICIGLLVTSIAQGQLYSGTSQLPEEREKVKRTNEESWHKMREARIATMSIESQTFKKGVAKGDLCLSIKTQYNQDGRSTAQEGYVKRGKLWQTSESEYDALGNTISQSYQNRKGHNAGRKTFAYEGSLLKSIRNYSGKKDRCTSQSEFSYDAGGRLLEVKTNNPLKEKLINRTLYSYNEDGSKKTL